MIYGLYLSASGMISASHRQDVIANNLANSETTGFKRLLSLQQQRSMEVAEGGAMYPRDSILDEIGGGLFLAPTEVDRSQGALDATGAKLDLAVVGEGYFAIRQGDEVRLTRNGNFILDNKGQLILANSGGAPVLDNKQQPIRLDARRGQEMVIDRQGVVSYNGEFAAQIGVFGVEDRQQLIPVGGNLMSAAGQRLNPAVDARVESGFLETSNVDPATELTRLMESQRQLEANANMIRYQDQALGRLVNDVGKIS